MNKILPLAMIAALGLSACVETTPTQNTVLGAVGGAAAGAAVSSKRDRTEGALIGAALGAAAGTVLNPTNNAGKCYYADGRGGRYIAAC